MKKLKLFSVLFLLFVMITSCSKSDTAATPSLSTGDYWPTAVNNIWNYSDGTTSTPAKIISTNGGYYLFDNFVGNTSGGTAANSPTSIKKDNGDYYVKYGTIQFSGTFAGTMSGFEMIILKDYLAVGGTWSTTYSQTLNLNGIPPTTTTTTDTGTIMETGISLTIGGVTYTNVIHVKHNLVSSGSQSVPEFHYWFSKNVGLIRYNDNNTSSQIHTTSLINYTLY